MAGLQKMLPQVASSSLQAVLTPLPASSGGWDHTTHCQTETAPSTNVGNSDVVWMLPCEAVTLV